MPVDDADFARNNQACIEAGLAWLRACLLAEERRLAPGLPPLTHKPPAVEQEPRWPWRRKAQVQQELPPAGDTPQAEPASTGGLAEARQAYENAADAQPSPALVTLGNGMGLNTFERDMLLLAAAPELDPDMPALIASAQGDPYRRSPTFALGMSLFQTAGWDAMAPERPLRAMQLLEVHQSGADSLLAAPLRIDERIAAYIKGLNYLDERIEALVTLVVPPAQLPPHQQLAAQQLSYWLAPDGGSGIVQLLGADTSSKRDVLATAAASAGHRLMALPASALPEQPQDMERFLHLWQRETRLLPLTLLIEGAETHADHEDADKPHALPTRLLQRLPGTVFVDARFADAAWGSTAVVLVEPPLATERATLWHQALMARGIAIPDESALSRLANEFQLSASRIAGLAAGVAPAANLEPPVRAAWNACVEHTAGALDGLAQRIVVRAALDDVALPPHEKQQLRRLVEHAGQRIAVLNDYGFAAHANRGLGMAALLHGESGTGKTMAAEAVAQALSLALFRVDLSAVVSKYIGETSKNLRRVFDAAEGGGAVLLFDEADAVFGKRSEVKDSHDRYANIDINYLLTRMEQFPGVTLLVTNMKHALDHAFMRRLRFIIGFPFPGVAERKEIWSRVFPDPSRLDSAQLDLERLARFAMTGGAIFNAALAAAHNAAAAHADIGMPHILDAIRWELLKIGRPVAESEFAWTPANTAAPSQPSVEVPA